MNLSKQLSHNSSSNNQNTAPRTSVQSGSYVFQNASKADAISSNGIMVEPVSTIEDFKTFYRFPIELYKNDDHWVSPFWSEFKHFFHTKNPFWNHAKGRLFLAKKDNQVVGRIAAIIDHAFCKAVGQNIGYFGFFECIEDFSCATALWEAAQSWLISNKMEVMRGPIDGRIDKSCGFLSNGFDSPPGLLSSYSPPYYVSFAQQFRMKKSRDFIEYTINIQKPLPSKLQEKANRCLQ